LEELGIPSVTLASLCLAFASLQLRPLARGRRVLDQAGDMDLRRLRQGRWALIAAMTVLVLTGCGQMVAALQKQNYNMTYDAVFTWAVVIAIYASVYRNLTRNFAVAVGALIVWLVVGACFVAFNISTGDRILAAADVIAELCFAVLLARLWPDIRRRRSANQAIRERGPAAVRSSSA
jgi:hypothetical protein